MPSYLNKIILMSAFLMGLVIVPLHAWAGNSPQEEQNKKVVLAFYDAALNQKDFAKAAQYLGPYYKQHNPTAADGADGFKNFVAMLRTRYPQSHSEIKQVFVDGNYVILHVHSVRIPHTAGRAIIDIFKLQNGKIIEHWDVVQDIPAQAANSNSMF